MTQHAVGRVAMRAHLIQLSARGFSAYEIAHLHDVSDPTVYKWIERFGLKLHAAVSAEGDSSRER